MLLELLGIWTLPIVHNSKKLENSVLETGSISILRLREESTYSVEPLRKS
jgi:hypothetical protein